MIARLLLVAATVAAPTAVGAQTYSCTLPAGRQSIRPDLPSAEQPRRLLPIGGYTLAVTWAPQYCRDHAREPSARFECGSGNRFGFTLHGLWPDGIGKDWPQYCAATPILPQAVVKRHLCATPSAQLLQHEWAKHGTCVPRATPTTYFARSGGVYARLRYPDMEALSRGPLDAGTLAAAIARANPGMGADMMRITTTRDGWLDEIWFCLDKAYRYARCPAYQGGVAANAGVKIWRGRR